MLCATFNGHKSHLRAIRLSISNVVGKLAAFTISPTVEAVQPLTI